MKRYAVSFGTICLVAAVLLAWSQAVHGSGRQPQVLAAPIHQTTHLTNKQLRSKLDAYLTLSTKVFDFGGSALITRQGQQVLRKGYGLANRPRKNVANSRTVYPIRQLTTDFTATAILQLQDQGKLSVKDPMCKYLPSCPTALQPITIDQLLMYSSGLPSPKLDVTKPFTVQDLMNSFSTTPPKFAAGSKWEFSDTGYVILGFIVEKVTGQPYKTYIQNAILKPLGMTHTGFADQNPHPTFALGYHGTVLQTKTAGPGYDPAWGMYSTVSDLHKFDVGLTNHKVLSQAAVDAMFVQHIKFANGSGYGYGWNSGVYNKHRYNITYEGSSPGYTGVHVRLPDDNGTIVILSNQDQTTMVRIVTDFIQLIAA